MTRWGELIAAGVPWGAVMDLTDAECTALANGIIAARAEANG